MIKKIKKAIKYPILIKFRIIDFFIYFYHTANPKFFNPLFFLRIINEKSKKNKLRKNKELWTVLTKAISKSNSTGCEYSDYHYLYEKTLTGKYKCILELGSGISSIVLAFAAKQLHESGVRKPSIISIEENIDYHNHAKSIIPDDLTEYLSMIQSDRVQENKNGIDICYYKNIPDMRYDLIFVDGPSLTQKNGRKTINYDLINIFNSNENFKADVIIDQRIATYWTYKKIFYGSKSSYHPIKQLGFVKIDNSHIDFNKFNRNSLWWHDREVAKIQNQVL